MPSAGPASGGRHQAAGTRGIRKEMKSRSRFEWLRLFDGLESKEKEYGLEMESYRKVGKRGEKKGKGIGIRLSGKNRKNFLLNGTREKLF